MSNRPPSTGVKLIRFMQKFAVSAFVICSFGAYAVHEHFASPDTTVKAFAPTEPVATLPAPDSSATQPAPETTPTPQLSFADPTQPAAPAVEPTTRPAPTVRPTPTTAPSATSAPARTIGQYRDGTYTGPEINAFWGMVQIQAVVTNGKLANVQFLQYPSDRRTSVRINRIAVPDLQSEALQAQSANVDIISGATLTSEAFAQSLQTALSQARN